LSIDEFVQRIGEQLGVFRRRFTLHGYNASPAVNRSAVVTWKLRDLSDQPN
jgi:hypothetical protein